MHTKMPKITELCERTGSMTVLQLHDAFYLEVLEDEVPRVARQAKMIMESPVTAPNGMTFQLPASVEVGDNFFALEEYEI